jgi:hypothetical protein
MTFNADPKDSGADSTALALMWSTSFLIIARLIVAIVCRTHLYNDGGPYLWRLMASPRPMSWDYSRRFAHLITQLPVVAAIHTGVRGVGALSLIQGVGLQLPFLAGFLVCLWIARRQPQYAVFPLLSAAGVTANSTFFAISESQVLVGLFWPLVFLLTLRRVWSWPIFVLATFFALPTLRCYESMLFMGPVLAGLSAWRAWRSYRESDGIRAVGFSAFTMYFLGGAAIGLKWTIHPNIPENFENFKRSILFFMDGQGHWHLPALLSIAAIVLVVCALVFRNWSNRGSIAALVVFAIVAIVVSTSLVFWPDLFAPVLDARARTLNAFLPPIIALLFLFIVRSAPSRRQVRYSLAVVMLLAIAQSAYLVTAAREWVAYLDVFREEVATHSGLVAFDQTALALKRKNGHPVSALNSDWNLPVMSVLLSPGGDVKAIIENQDPYRWQPFDPTDSEHFKDLTAYGIHYDEYRAALLSPSPGKQTQ